MKTYFVKEHQHKHIPFVKELIEAGLTFDKKTPDIALFDEESPLSEMYHERGADIYLYPITATPPYQYDSRKFPDYVKSIFVIGKGHKEIADLLNLPAEICGWTWCKQKYFKQPHTINNILFAPIHPIGINLCERDRMTNAAIQRELVGLPVTCRYVGELKDQGLEWVAGWNWVPAQADGSYRDIDAADVVIAEGTFMYLSVARGKPTVGINQRLPKLNSPNWNKYVDIMAYPINYQEGKLKELIELAAEGEQTRWRRRMIGEDMDSFMLDKL